MENSLTIVVLTFYGYQLRLMGIKKFMQTASNTILSVWQSMAVKSAIRKIRKIEVLKSGNCSPWTVIKITTIHSTDCNQITMGIWTRWIIVIITTDIFAVHNSCLCPSFRCKSLVKTKDNYVTIITDHYNFLKVIS